MANLCPLHQQTYVSNDVSFDEKFAGALVRLESRKRMQGGIALQPHPQDVTDDDQVEVVGFNPPSDQGGESDAENLQSLQNYLGDNHDDGGDVILCHTSPRPQLFTDVETPDSTLTPDTWDPEPKYLQDLVEEVKDSDEVVIKDPTPRLRRSARLRKKALYVGKEMLLEAPDIPENIKIPDDIQEYSNMALWHDLEEMKKQIITIRNTEKHANSGSTTSSNKQESLEESLMNTPLEDIDWSKLDGSLFQPEPEHWKQIFKLLPHLKKV